MKKYAFVSLLLLLVVTSSCRKGRVFDKNNDFDYNSWAIADIQEFKFEIKDPAKKYAIYFNVRNAIFYEYYNLYIKHTLLNPDGKLVSTNLHELFLMDKTTGEPLGEGAGDIYDHQVLALKNQRFPKAGTYTIKLQQYMRRDPLPGILSVGIRVEKQEE